jgi:D-alanyl-D-alanine carboxypeptidase/D-alanyl-D-alanine-endopeptidase (penicillin-binding protein 4)
VCRRIRCVALLALYFPVLAAAQTDSGARQELADRLTALLPASTPQGEVGLVVANIADGETWFTLNPRTPLKPASVLKLFVTAAALEYFGPDFQYETRVYVKEGELRVIGAGDPGLGDERLLRRDGHPLTYPFDAWIAALKTRGIGSLARIVLDDSVFDQHWRHPDWPDDQANAWYEAPVGGLNLDDNCVDARIEPQRGTVKLTLRPALPAAYYENRLTLGRKHQPVARRAPDRDVFEFVGPVARAADLGPVSAGRPTVFFGYALKQALTDAGIAVRGEVVRRAMTPEDCAGATLLATYATPLPDVLWRANTFSQNLFAECLVKSLAAYAADGRRNGRAGSWPQGLAQVRSIMSKLSVDMADAVLRDGSGLSHENRVTAEQVTNLLLCMHRHRYRAVFQDSLARPGEDGSMRYRFADQALLGRLRGKTGTLNGVHALAGYAIRPDGTTLAFALLCNGAVDADLPARVARALVGSAGSP